MCVYTHTHTSNALFYFRKVNDFQWPVSTLCCALTLSHPCFLVSLQLVLDPLGFPETSGPSTKHRNVSGCTWRNMWLPCCSLHRQSMLSPSKVKRTFKARLDSAVIHLFLGPVVRLHHSLYPSEVCPLVAGRHCHICLCNLNMFPNFLLKFQFEGFADSATFFSY